MDIVSDNELQGLLLVKSRKLHEDSVIVDLSPWMCCACCALGSCFWACNGIERLHQPSEVSVLGYLPKLPV